MSKIRITENKLRNIISETVKQKTQGDKEVRDYYQDKSKYDKNKGSWK